MLVVHDEAVFKHAPEVEMHRGQTLSPFESPARVESIVNELRKGSFTFREPEAFDLSVLERVHAADYVEFLKTVYDQWTDLGADGAMVPHVWPSRMMTAEVPDSIFGRLGYYSFDAGTTIAAGTWETIVGRLCDDGCYRSVAGWRAGVLTVSSARASRRTRGVWWVLLL
jgi:acetoin utilization deacetylase AcuC-like enzyme